MTTSGSITTEQTSVRVPPTKGESFLTKLKSPPTMRSVRFHGRGDIRVDTIEEPTCGKGQVKVVLATIATKKLLSCTDMHSYLTAETSFRWNLR